MIIIAVITVIVLLLFISKLKYESSQHTDWFSNLKPGDKIFVQIYSNDCECLKEAIVINSAIGNYIDAKIVDLEKCISCSKINAIDENNNNTCWYNVTRFYKYNVVKIEEKNK